MITIKEWMNNKTILITGGAGFFGKVLTEKLLRTCDVKRIYLIIRPKLKKSPQERWNEIVQDALFEKLLAEVPDIMERKITVLAGDMSLINLGLSQEIIEELKSTVNVIFHSAATVRFNDPLHKAVLSNTRGTLELCKLASESKNFEVFVYVSTAYCHCNLKKTYYEEKVYEPCQDWNTILKLIETENPLVMNSIAYKIVEDHPNTYTFSKSLSEKIVAEYSCKFPAVIARPPVVVGVLYDPILGWTDNLNGLIGVSTASCKGVMRVLKGDGNCCLDYIPVDVAINALIIGGWDKANSENKELLIYNCTYSNIPPLSFNMINELGMDVNEKHCTLDNDIWRPFLILTMNDIYFYFLFFFLQVLPAAFIDLILFIFNKERRLIKINIKIYHALQALSSFTVRSFIFDCKQYTALQERVTEDEAQIFPLKPPSNCNWHEIVLVMHKGVKQYFLKENLEDNEYHKKKLMRLVFVDRLFRGTLIILAFITSYKLINAALDRYIV